MIKRLLDTRDLQSVSASLESATAYLDSAQSHLASALVIAATDPDGAYALLYDAARKSLSAVLQAQGLRPTSKGGHYTIQEAIAAQFTEPPPRDVFRPYARLRRTRNQIEYDDISSITVDDVLADHVVASAINATARVLVPALPVFTG